MNKRVDRREFLLIVVLAVLFFGCGGDAERQETRPKSVVLAEVGGMDTAVEKTFSGVVKEGGSINVGFKTGGQIATINVKEGDYVRQGQLLATLDDADYRLGLAAAQAQYDQLSDEVERLRSLYEAKSISGNDYEKAVSGLRQVEVNLDVNKNKVAYTRLYAPASGYVQAVNFNPSEMVGAGTPVLTLLDTRSMEVWITIPVGLYMYRDKMASFSCRSTFGDSDIRLTPISINPKADNSQLYRMRLALPHDTKGLTAGMNVEVHVGFANAEAENQQAVIPSTALFEHQGKDCVWVFETADSTVHRREVRKVSVDITAGQVQCTGLDGGERVVRAGVHNVSDGERVRPIGEASETNIGGLI